MFASVRQYVEPKTKSCWLKVEVTIERHEFEPWISYQLHNSFTLEGKLWWNVRLSETVWRTPNLTIPTYGHNWRSRVIAFSFMLAP